MNLQSAFMNGAGLLVVVIIIGIVACCLDRHDKGGEFDWKDFGKWVFYGLTLGVAAFVASLIRH